MNDADLKDLERQLERATAAGSPSDVPLDEDTQALRETWLSLTSLLEATQPAAGEPFELRLPSARSNGPRLAGLVALAASLLAVVALGWHLLGSAGTSSPTVPTNRIAQPETKPLQPAREHAVVQSDDIQLDWDDSLDEQLVSAGRAMVRVQQDWYGLERALTPLQHGLELMQEDIENNQL